MRVGMFVTATFYGKQPETRVAVPADAILHLHDREWVYTPIRRGTFQAARSDCREHASRQTCRRWFRGSSREITWSQTLWRCKTRWSNKVSHK